MCEAMTIAAIGQGLGAGAQAKAQMEAGLAEGLILDKNARLARAYAIDAIPRGAAEAGQARMAGSRVIAKGRAAVGGSGVAVESSTFLDTAGTTRAISELDVETLKTNALRESLGYIAQAEDFEARADLARKTAGNAALATLLGAAPSAMGTAYQGGASFPKLGKA